ncbi:MAG: hypothetical protein EOQ44_25525 [Mesorhizobium sp.]|uniref:hypothetical protein n=1 Tax=Mesorhizobium sp. TaxID=1871066 RepID=UPI000FE9828A|nr:hypothetical protein [Mesorhizobium sp.]RWB40501.1 MAG: hypothetical protein EOQ44_25525 [Mesorhizobium sp.]
MTMFSRIEGGQVLLTKRGIYTEADLYKRDNELFVSLKAGFARLLGNNHTTADGIKWKTIEGVPFIDTPFGPRELEPPSEEDKAAMASGKRVRAKLRAI